MNRRKTALTLGLAALAVAALALLVATRRQPSVPEPPPPASAADPQIAPDAPRTADIHAVPHLAPHVAPGSPAPRAVPAVDPSAPWPFPAATETLFSAPRQTLSPAPHVLAIAGLGPDRDDPKARRAAINSLTVNLPPDDIAALVEFLLVPHDENSGVSRTIYNTLRNDVLEVLVRQEALPDGLGGLMVAMARNTEEDDVWRDYSVQYMAEYYRRRWTPESDIEADPDGRDERLQMLAAYNEALAEKTSTLAGTALIGFESLSRLYPEADRAETADIALYIAEDEERSAAARLTALRLGASLGDSRVLDTARILAQTGETVPLRMAAIATLGDLGRPEDRSLLQALLGASEPGIVRIAQAALDRLNAALAAGGAS